MLLVARVPFLATLLLSAGEAIRTQRETERQTAEDVQLLKAARLPADGPGLLRFFHNQSVTEPDVKDIARSVHALADKSFKVRERAAFALTSCGPAALPLLRRQQEGTDLEVRQRLGRCIEAIQARHARSAVWGAAARRLEALSPEGACAALLAYLPGASGDARDEILATLLAVGARNGKLDPAVVAALTDLNPARRAAAALVFAWRGDAKQQEAVRRLLRTDPEPQVVLRAAEGLLAVGDATPIPVLLNRIRAGDVETAVCADDLLRWAAVPTVPNHPGRWDSVGRHECHAAWQFWWQRQKGRIHLPPRAPAALTPLAKRAARLAAQRFCDALRDTDLPALRRLTDLPFLLWHGRILETILDSRVLGERLRAQQVFGPQWTVVQVLQLSDYLTRRESPGHHQLLDLPGSRLCIVFAEPPAGRPLAAAAVFVRVAYGQARVVGMDRFSAARLP